MPKHSHDPQLLKMIGVRLQEARLARGHTQQTLAEAISIEPVTLSRYECGARGASISTLKAVADFLELKLADLVDDGKPLPEPVRDPRISQVVQILEHLDDHRLDIVVSVVDAIKAVH